MEKNKQNITALIIFAGIALLVVLAGSFYFVQGVQGGNIYAYLLLAVAFVIVVLSATYAYLIFSGRITNVQPDYRMLFIMGIIFLPIALSSGMAVFFVIDFMFITVGFINRNKWKKQEGWSEMSSLQKTLIIVFMTMLGILVIATFFILYLADTKKPAENVALSEQEARATAERDCIKSGESLLSGAYNESTKTWWFDAKLNDVPEGCNPACVVSEKMKMGGINWRCTGLVPPAATAAEAIREIFAKKYPKYSDTISVTVEKETKNHARGSVSFETGAPGGIFLAVKVNTAWQLVFDGNGQIPCDLSRYGFPRDMLADCSV